MCGILVSTDVQIEMSDFESGLDVLRKRGPDDRRIMKIPEGIIGFQRLAIMGVDESGMQPFVLNDRIVVCNGELYGFRPIKKELEKEYTFKSESDCEIILPLYEKYGLKMFSMLDAEFAMVIYDGVKKEWIAARDPIGIRPLFYGYTENNKIAFGSLAASLMSFCKEIHPFPIGSYYYQGKFIRYDQIEKTADAVMALQAEEVQIWTDVDGVMTADPRVVEHPVTLREIAFEEAAEMAHFGAKVLHPMTIEPAVRLGIPIYVLDSTHPDSKGTGVFGSERIPDGIKAVSSKENIQVINIFSTKMLGASGFLSKVFGVFSDHKVPVDMISTSEANISVTVDGGTDLSAVVAELSEFADVTVDRDKSQISVIGKNLHAEAGLFAALSKALGPNGIHMISQGATFINLSLVVDRSICKETVRLIHQYLFENHA